MTDSLDLKCTPCTLGRHSLWANTYTITLAATTILYLLKNFSDSKLSVNLIVSALATAASIVLLNTSTADHDDCASRDVIVEKHNSASLLWFALFIGYTSIATGLFKRTITRPYIVLGYMIIFCIIFMIAGATNRHKSTLMCPNTTVQSINGKKEFEFDGSSTSPQCKEYIGVQCKSDMRKNGHSYFSVTNNENKLTCKTYKELSEENVKKDSGQSAVYYESSRMDTAQKSFLLNASLALFFASII